MAARASSKRPELSGILAFSSFCQLFSSDLISLYDFVSWKCWKVNGRYVARTWTMRRITLAMASVLTLFGRCDLDNDTS